MFSGSQLHIKFAVVVSHSNVPFVTRRILLHMSFLSPIIVVILWIKPIARDFLANAPFGKTTITL